MNNREFFITRWEAEQPAFAKVIRAVPEGKLAYRPHEKSAAAGGLAWQLVQEQKLLTDLLKSGEMTWPSVPHPEKSSDISAAWEKATTDLRAALKAADDARWSSEAKMIMGGEVGWKDTTQNMFWGFLFDMVHHRGQLSVYLRPMGGKVPAIYGPSADEKS